MWTTITCFPLKEAITCGSSLPALILSNIKVVTATIHLRTKNGMPLQALILKVNIPGGNFISRRLTVPGYLDRAMLQKTIARSWKCSILKEADREGKN
jgi:hypothetical protein